MVGSRRREDRYCLVLNGTPSDFITCDVEMLDRYRIQRPELNESIGLVVS